MIKLIKLDYFDGNLSGETETGEPTPDEIYVNVSEIVSLMPIKHDELSGLVVVSMNGRKPFTVINSVEDITKKIY